MKWEVVKLQDTTMNSGRRSIAYASIGFGRISLNTAACELIPGYQNYSFAELLKGRQKNKLCVGVRFLTEEEKTPNAIPFRRRMKDGVPHGGIDIHGKRIMEELFGPAASASKSTKYNVAKDDDCDNILIIFAE